MPVPPGTRYRVKNGVRLAFSKGGDVVEAKNLKTGATHTAAEFKADRRRKTVLTGKRGALMDHEAIKKASELLDKAAVPRGHRMLYVPPDDDINEGRLVCECGASCLPWEPMEHRT